jgi:hypothetical protein
MESAKVLYEEKPPFNLNPFTQNAGSSIRVSFSSIGTVAGCSGEMVSFVLKQVINTLVSFL